MEFQRQSITHFPGLRLLVIVLAAIACISCDQSTSKGPLPSSGSQTASIDITADALHAAYLENGAAGDRRFRGQVLNISGRVGDIQMFGDRPVINLPANKGRGIIQCYFEPDQAEAVAKIAPGQQVKIRGRCDGFVEGAVLVKECSVK